MVQVREYKGYIQNGRVVSPEIAMLPENTEVTIRATGQILPFGGVDEKLTSEQKIVASNFLEAVRKLRQEGFSEETEAAIDDLQNGKYKAQFEERLQ